MADPKGFMKYGRELPQRRPVEDRVNDYKEIYKETTDEMINAQSARCMDCGIPFCHSGCPLGNIIPDFNDAVYRNDWYTAYQILSSTNNFPEFTGRICPAPCEAACVLGINSDPVTIENIEKNIIEKAFENGWVSPNKTAAKTGKKVAVVGSGPAGLAAADQINKAGHDVTVFERNNKIGGLLRYGIPDFKLEKSVIDRRLEVMKASGIEFKVNANVGENVKVEDLMSDYDAIVLSGGSTIPRDLPIDGRDIKGVHFAMEFLEQRNKQVDQQTDVKTNISATNKHVVVIGGGDTGADCVGTSNRDKAASVTQIELLSKPPTDRAATTPWPVWPMQLRTSSSHEEGCERQWALLTKEFVADENGHVKSLKIAEIEWNINPGTGKAAFTVVPDTLREIPCDLALLAVGFVHPQHEGLLEQIGVGLDIHGNVASNSYQTSIDKVFTAGDMNRGQSLVVWAISEGREAAIEVDKFLSGGTSVLEAKEASKLMV